jgi:AdoMet-dependent heme synthase
MLSNQSFDFFVQWHLTERCNLRCRHCYQSGGGTGEITLEQGKEILAQVSDMLRAWEDAYDIGFSSSFNVTGGEPFLRQDLFLILEEIRKKRFDVFLLTNGVLLDREKAGRLAALGIKGVQVSIEGPEEIHDSIRGKGGFAAAMGGVGHLLDAGLTVTLNATLSTINADYFREMIAVAVSAGVQRLGFSRLVPAGRGLELADMMLDKEKVRNLYEEIFAMKVNGLDIVTGDPVASQMREGTGSGETGDIPLGGCSAGASGITLLPDGTILPCRRLPIPIGNVLKDSLREVWATSEVLEALRDKTRYSGKCGNCKRWAQCRGCRAIAYAYAQTQGSPDFLAEDPQCFLGES